MMRACKISSKSFAFNSSKMKLNLVNCINCKHLNVFSCLHCFALLTLIWYNFSWVAIAAGHGTYRAEGLPGLIHFWLQSFYTANVYRSLQGVCRFSLQYLWNRAVRITEKPYTPQRLCMLWGNTVIFTDCGENPMITIAFPCNL